MLGCFVLAFVGAIAIREYIREKLAERFKEFEEGLWGE